MLNEGGRERENEIEQRNSILFNCFKGSNIFTMNEIDEKKSSNLKGVQKFRKKQCKNCCFVTYYFCCLFWSQERKSTVQDLLMYRRKNYTRAVIEYCQLPVTIKCSCCIQGDREREG